MNAEVVVEERDREAANAYYRECADGKDIATLFGAKPGQLAVHFARVRIEAAAEERERTVKSLNNLYDRQYIENRSVAALMAIELAIGLFEKKPLTPPQA